MASRTITTTILIDDMDGTEITGAGETVRFSLDGTTYEIDLGEENAQALREALRPFVEAARKPFATRTRVSSRSSKEDLSAAREWLRRNGHQVSDRGRIPGPLMDLYRAAS